MNSIRLDEKLAYALEILDQWNRENAHNQISFEIVEEMIISKERWKTFKNAQEYALSKHFARKLPKGLFDRLYSLMLQE